MRTPRFARISLATKDASPPVEGAEAAMSAAVEMIMGSIFFSSAVP